MKRCFDCGEKRRTWECYECKYGPNGRFYKGHCPVDYPKKPLKKLTETQQLDICLKALKEIKQSLCPIPYDCNCSDADNLRDIASKAIRAANKRV
jgi:hypothetical protein